MSPIVNPEIPYTGEIPGGLQPGKMCRIQGVTHPNADRFNINLQTGPNSTPRDDTAFHLSVRLNQGYIARNTYKDGEWGDEQGSGKLPIGTAQAFEILILVEPNNYKVAVNGQHHCDFPHRIPFDTVTNLLINGDVSITLISWEASAPVLKETLSQAAQLNAEGPQAPQQQPNQPSQPGPQGPYNPQFSGYGPQGPYGPPPAGYGPPVPPGAEPQSGLDNFLEQAQTVLAGAIKSGAAEKLLGSFLSSGGQQQQQPPQGQGYTPQNARYGIYPQLPQDENAPNYNRNQGPGPVESFLSSFLSGGNSNQQQSYPQNPQPVGQPQQVNQSQSQQPDYGQYLSTLLAGLLAPGNNQQAPRPQNYGGSPAQPPTFQSQQPTPQSQQNTNTNDVSDILANIIAGKGNASQPQPNQSVPLSQENQPQQQYGQYPGPQQQQHPQEQRGPLESLLSGFLGGNNPPPQQQQPHIPQIGGEGSIGGLGSMGGLLTNLAGQILHKPRDGNN